MSRSAARSDVDRRRGRALACTATALLLGFCQAGALADSHFSQHPGFAEWYAANPPGEQVPDDAGRALLARYKPRVFLPAGHEGPIDFYRDYIAYGRLSDGEGERVSTAVTRALLNRHKDDPAALFEHEPPEVPPRPVIYGRIDEADIPLPGCAAPLPATFLTYHLVFRYSGLPLDLSWWQEAALGLVADLEDWHQLDHYTSLRLALAEDPSGALRPFAATLQQHNYLRTYLLGDREAPGQLELPPDGRLPVDVAIRSNELYPHRTRRVRRRAARFLSPEAVKYLVSGEDQPWLAADDVTEPAREVEPALELLPPADAFYVFEGWLGERRLLPGRDGPPGADYNTLPAFKPGPVQLALFYWYEDDREYVALITELFADGRPASVDPERFLARLDRDLRGTWVMASCRAAALRSGVSRRSP